MALVSYLIQECYHLLIEVLTLMSYNARVHLVHGSVGEVLQQDLSMKVIGHYFLPFSSRVRHNGKSGGRRGILEKSTSHMLLFVETLCPKASTILELGSGIRTIFEAAMHTSCG